MPRKPARTLAAASCRVTSLAPIAQSRRDGREREAAPARLGRDEDGRERPQRRKQAGEIGIVEMMQEQIGGDGVETGVAGRARASRKRRP